MSEIKIRNIKDEITPLEVVQKVNWENAKRVIVLVEYNEQETYFISSAMSYKDQVWLLNCGVEHGIIGSTVSALKG